LPFLLTDRRSAAFRGGNDATTATSSVIHPAALIAEDFCFSQLLPVDPPLPSATRSESQSPKFGLAVSSKSERDESLAIEGIALFMRALKREIREIRCFERFHAAIRWQDVSRRTTHADSCCILFHSLRYATMTQQ
jgi:hypothetical protein